MAPDPGGGAYTVSCALGKAVGDPTHLAALRDAVKRVHACTYHATDLLNLYVRDCLENRKGSGLDHIFSQNWLINAYYAVSVGAGRAPKGDLNTQAVFDTHMAGTIEPPSRSGLTQTLKYECLSLATVGKVNVWKHFQKRVLAFTRTAWALDEAAYAALSKDERSARKLALMQAADDVCRKPAEPKRSPDAYHAWVDETRATLGIDTAVGDDWDDKPLLYHLKAKPHRFLKAMHHMSLAQHAAGRKAFALFPLRRTHVPRHVRFDQKALDDLLKFGEGRAVAKARKAAVGEQPATGRAPKRKRDDPSLLQEKAGVFGRVLDLKRAGVHRRHHFAFGFTTDGYSLHLNMEKPGASKKKGAPAPLRHMPRRGLHSIDALKAVMRSPDDLHVVGLDPGKRELAVCVDSDDPKGTSAVRYTLAQRRRDLRTRQQEAEVRHWKPRVVADAEEELSRHHSKAPSLEEYAAFSRARRRLLRACAAQTLFYAWPDHRQRRRRTRIKAQKSEARFVQRVRAMHAADDPRHLVLAYGSWGLVAGRPNVPGNQGLPPTLGAGLLHKLAREFVVALTPEQYTSKTCVKCGGNCDAHPTLRTKENKEIRGLRVCQHEGCGLHQNRDKTGATNIGFQFVRLVRSQPPLRRMTEEDLEFNRLESCLACDSS